MISEIGEFGYDDGHEKWEFTSPSNGHAFYQHICSQDYDYRAFGKNITPHVPLNETTQKMANIFPMGSVSGEVGVSISWGGENGTEVSGHASGSVSDDNGNKAEVKVEVQSDGSGTASVSASHDEK